MENPTRKEIESAKAYIRDRLDAELSMKNNLEDLLLQGAKDIISISYKYNIPPSLFKFSQNGSLKKEVDSILENIRYLIYDYCETLSIAKRTGDKKEIIAFINMETHEKTLKERIGIYTNRYKYELEAAIAAGLFFNTTKEKLFESVKSFMASPYKNPIIIRASQSNNLSATRIKTGGISYGVGKSNSSYNSLNALTRYTISEAWMWLYMEDAIKNGAVGFYSFRGSSYPCSLCDSMVGYHTDFSNYAPYHGNCCCYLIPVYQ